MNEIWNRRCENLHLSAELTVCTDQNRWKNKDENLFSQEL